METPAAQINLKHVMLAVFWFSVASALWRIGIRVGSASFDYQVPAAFLVSVGLVIPGLVLIWLVKKSYAYFATFRLWVLFAAAILSSIWFLAVFKTADFSRGEVRYGPDEPLYVIVAIAAASGILMYLGSIYFVTRDAERRGATSEQSNLPAAESKEDSEPKGRKDESS